jgi:hypothetical protein
VRRVVYLCSFGDALAKDFDFEVPVGGVQCYRHGGSGSRWEVVVLLLVYGFLRRERKRAKAFWPETLTSGQSLLLGVSALELWPPHR